MFEPPVREGMLAVPGGRVWFGVYGRGPRTPLLVLHGGPGLPHDYLLPLAALADERRVVFYDQLGCGRSEAPDDPTLWRLARFVAELRVVRAALGLAAVHLFGHSWGAMLAAAYALARPAGLRSLILASPVLSVPRYVADLRRLQGSLPPDASAPPAPADALNAAAPPGLAVYRTLWGRSELEPTGELSAFDCTPRLGEIAVPTLFTCGAHDPATPAATAADAARTPRAALHVFAGSGHLPHLEETDAYLQVLRDFLPRVERA